MAKKTLASVALLSPAELLIYSITNVGNRSVSQKVANELKRRRYGQKG